jgi:transcription-repair coupling factor (superfamily II helicase)
MITTPDAALGYTIPKETLKKSTVKIDFDTRIEPADMAEKLVDAGFSRVDMVEGAGQFALRGGIVDIYPPYGEYLDADGEVRTGSYPLRIEFFDDEIDRMGIFDPESQRMAVNVESATFTPAKEVIVTREIRDVMEAALRKRFKECKDEKAC